MSSIRIVRESVVIFLSLAAVIYFINKGMFLFAISPTFVIVFFRLMPNTSLAFLLIFAMGALNFKLPFYPSNMPNALPFVVLYTAAALATFAIKKTPRDQHRLTTLQKSSFFVVISTIMLLAIARSGSVSGSNFSSFWYGVIAISALIFIISRGERFSLRQMNGLVWCFVTATFINAFVQALVILTGTRFMWITNFIDVSTEATINATAFGQKHLIQRFSALNGAAATVTFFALRYLKLNRTILAHFIFALAIALAALSSYRYGLLTIILCFGIYVILFIKRKMHIFLTALVFSVLGCASLYILAPILPFQMQRGISFLPGINIPHLAQSSAVDTIDWRLDLWKYTLGQIDNYLLVGRGLTRDYESVLALNTIQRSRYHAVLFNYHLHTYHSSLLGLFIDLGIIGATSFIVFLTASLRQIHQGIKRLTNNSLHVTFLQYYFCIYLARIMVSTISGLSIDIMIYDAFISLALLYVMTQSLIEDQADNGIAT